MTVAPLITTVGSTWDSSREIQVKLSAINARYSNWIIFGASSELSCSAAARSIIARRSAGTRIQRLNFSAKAREPSSSGSQIR